jgi:transposase
MKGYANSLDLKGRCRYVFPKAHHKAGRRSPWHAAASPHGTFSYGPRSVRRWNGGNVRPPSRQDWLAGGRLSSCWQPALPNPRQRRRLACNGPWFATGPSASSPSGLTGSPTLLAAGPRAVFPPEVALHLVRLACERPDLLGRRLSQWDCAARAHQLIAEGMVTSISVTTVRRILAAHQLKPWRHHVWLSPKQPRDAAFYTTISELIDLYPRPLGPDELVLSVDEKTALQPRPRHAPTLPAQPRNIPHRYEHEYKRAGALNLFAAFDTRSGRVYGQCYERKRQQEYIAFLEMLDRESDEQISTIHLVGDNVSTHHGKNVSKWLTKHPRFVMHFTPVHCSWMNQVEQWFSILQRKRLRIADFESKDHLRAKLEQFIHEWNQQAHPFNWSKTSVAKVMAEAPALVA